MSCLPAHQTLLDDYAAHPEPLSAIEPCNQAVNTCTLHQSPELWQCCRLICLQHHSN